jgi:hypothetical protein
MNAVVVTAILPGRGAFWAKAQTARSGGARAIEATFYSTGGPSSPTLSTLLREDLRVTTTTELSEAGQGAVTSPPQPLCN